MPTYDFYCAQCDLSFTIFIHSYNDAAYCPNCHRPLKRLFSPTRALFIAEPFRDENIDTLRKWAHEMETDPRRRKAAEQAAAVARELNATAKEWEKLDERVDRFKRGEFDE
jgi:putative FmdB family regulatory protein